MKVKVIRSTVASGQTLSVGKVYDIDEEDAKLLIMLGKVTEEKRKEVRVKKR